MNQFLLFSKGLSVGFQIRNWPILVGKMKSITEVHHTPPIFAPKSSKLFLALQGRAELHVFAENDVFVK